MHSKTILKSLRNISLCYLIRYVKYRAIQRNFMTKKITLDIGDETLAVRNKQLYAFSSLSPHNLQREFESFKSDQIKVDIF